MRFRTFVGILLALVVVVFASYLTHQNIELVRRPFQLTATRVVPLYALLVAVFLLGFLPVVSVLLVQTLKRDLERRRDRRSRREARSRRGSFRRAVDLETDGQWGRAASELAAVLGDRPEDFPALLRYGEVLRRLGRAGEALEVHRRASVLYPHSVSILYQLADDYDAVGDTEVAEQIRDRILRDFPGQGLRILKRRRNRDVASGNWRSARRQQEKIDLLLGDGRETAEGDEGLRQGLEYQKAVEYLEQDRVAEGRLILERILDQDPRFLPAHIMLGEAALLEDDAKGALAAWEAGWRATGSPTLLQRIEDHFIEREDPPQAIETLHRLISAGESDLIPRLFLGRLYHRLEMHEEALKALEVLGERIRRSPRFHYLLGRVHQRRGEMGRAVEAYLACMERTGLLPGEYVCKVCDSRYAAWQDRCRNCGLWNVVDLEIEAEANDVATLVPGAWVGYGDDAASAPTDD